MISSLYLRLSVTDHCNLRCAYCRPAGGASRRKDGLSGELLVRAASLANHVLPLRKLRFTGGEPLLRNDLVDIVRSARAALPNTTLALTTNGVHLAENAAALRSAGLDALNVSLDTVHPDHFHLLTGAPLLHRVIDGLAAARDAGFDRLKINAVLLEDRNGDQLVELVRLAMDFGAEIRFIELMPNGAGAAIHARSFLSAQHALLRLEKGFRYEGPIGRSGTATRHRLRDGDRIVVVGFITPVSEPFCSGCDRLRLDSQGRLFGCLRSDHRTDLGPWLLTKDDASVVEAFRSMLGCKAGLSKHWMKRHMVAIGG
jgi:cyclic pyranopterin phosphate synthase